LLGLSMYDMSKINLYVSNNTILLIGFQQGFGMSFLAAPMTAAIFATLSASLRVEGAAMFSLLRNMGGSIGISIFFTRIAQQTQLNHERLGEHITAFTPENTLPFAWQWHTTAGAMTLNSEITRQAASVAYLDAYLIMAVCMIAVIPLCMMFRAPQQSSAVDTTEIDAANH